MFCICSSKRRSFLFVDKGVNLSQYKSTGCPRDSSKTLARYLTEEDYELIRSCKPSTKNQSYRIPLIYDWKNSNRSKCINNTAAPYFWEGYAKEKKQCVNGSPFMIANKTPIKRGCQIAAVFPESPSDMFYNNINWTSCHDKHPYICLVNSDSVMESISKCEHVTTTTIDGQHVTSTTTHDQALVILVGITAPLICLISLAVFLFCYFRSKKKKKQEVIEDNNQNEEAHYK